ncbi:MAG: hypothetical protein M1351_01215 [Candidatus Thermoplasmatota archaeon]|jgi:hypothetical protein|nr:hypothetical protein [Candidatus Thermoplasmatota archaeon]
MKQLSKSAVTFIFEHMQKEENGSSTAQACRMDAVPFFGLDEFIRR